MPATEPLLEAVAVTKHFGGLNALESVSLTIRKGEIYGLIGPNGAGKTTFFNCLTGLYPLNEGWFYLQGTSLAGLKPHAVARRGVARTFQNIRLFANMTALENVMVGRHVRTQSGVLGAILRGPGTRAEEAETRDMASHLLDYVGIGARAGDLAKYLPYGDQRRLEIARALASEPCLLALDEPAAGMNATETVALRRLLEQIRNDGMTLLLIEHDMALVMGLCDRVAVLEYGRKIAEGAPREIQQNATVIAAYLGVGTE
ncbi:branched chain amino acid/phenylalanine ABC transporter ATP binding subunit LivG [Gammaproteobacteria bacterium]